MRNILRLCAFCILIALPACSSSYPGLPDLPEKDWLAADRDDKTPKTEKFDIYSPEKTMTMDDLVWLAIQQSPVISRGRINLEISEISKRDAKWRYLPEMHLSYHITSNMTKYNEGSRYAGENYGETTYEVTFTGTYTNPVSTYFSVQAQDELLQTAIITQRKAIAEIIFKIAGSLLRMNMLEESIAVLERQIAEGGRKLESSSVREAHTSGASYSSTINENNLAALELQLRETKMELTVERTALKQLVGLDMKQALKVDAKSVFPLIASFRPGELGWKNCWERTEARYLARQQVRLEQANVYLAWASYLPSISLYVNESPGKGQSQPADAEADQFLHVVFDFPILDWGHRWRQADMASLRQRQRRLDEIQNAREYEQEWEAKEQKLLLAKAKVERWRQTASNAARRSEAMRISYENGAASVDMLAEQRQRQLDAEMSAIRAESDEAMTRLAWMHFASGLSGYYLGAAGYDKGSK